MHGERVVYGSDWVSVGLVDVTLPSGRRIDHHVVRVPRPAVATVVVRDPGEVLLIRRHRFITDTWGWEVPAGGVDRGETPLEAAARETREETGWAPGPLEQVLTYHPSNGLSDQVFHVFCGRGAEHEGAPTDPDEAAEVGWRDLGQVRELIADGEVTDGLSLTSLLWALDHVAT